MREVKTCIVPVRFILEVSMLAGISSPRQCEQSDDGSVELASIPPQVLTAGPGNSQTPRYLLVWLTLNKSVDGTGRLGLTSCLI